MQTRKRAKSATFGKKDKEKKAPVKELEKLAENAEVVERRSVSEKPQNDELSSTLPKSEPEPVTPDVTTPVNEFVTDSPLPSSEPVKPAPIEPPVITPGEQTLTSVSPPVPEAIQSPAAVTPPSTPSEQPVLPAASQELSPTLPPSAFTIQSNETTPVAKVESSKPRYVVYFLVVALLSFILGLGAMAAASYFGLVKVKLPTSFSVPSIPGIKPTPTVAVQPTAAPTTKPADLGVFTLSVLNGSGISGKAASVKTSLTAAGFKVSSTGNADKNTYTQTQISAKKSVDPAFLSALETELKKSFALNPTVATSPAASVTDVTIILGSQASQ